MRRVSVPLYPLLAIPALYLGHLLLLHLYAGILGVDVGGWSLNGNRPPPPPPPPPHLPFDHSQPHWSVSDDDLFHESRGPSSTSLSTSSSTYTSTSLSTYTSTSPSTSLSNDRPSASPQKVLFAPVSEQGRESDITDTFADYTHAAECGISSLDLHMPFSPLCPDKASLLEAMSNGGRAGYDMPYIPLRCDMRWYSTDEICGILSRFSHVYIIGDSLQRHLNQAFYVLLRRNIGLGGMRDWELGEEQTPDTPARDFCMCNGQVYSHNCSDRIISRLDWAVGNGSFDAPCATDAFDLSYHRLLSWPLSDYDLNGLSDTFPAQRPAKPPVFLVHHTHWNKIDLNATRGWLAQVNDQLQDKVPWLDGLLKKLYLYMTASAGGLTSAFGITVSMGSRVEVANFELKMRDEAREMGIDFLGLWNMSAQTLQTDAVHSTLRTNLLKAQMALNWMDRLDVETIWAA